MAGRIGFPLALLVALLGSSCGSARFSSVDVPPPRAPFSVSLALGPEGALAPVAELGVVGVLEAGEAERGTGRARLVVREASRVATVSMARAFDPALLADWRGRAVRLDATLRADGADVTLAEANGGGLLLLVVSRRFAERLPGQPDEWGTPPDLPLRRVTGASVLRTTGDGNDCVALSVHYPLEVVGGAVPLRLEPDTWVPAAWRGQTVALLNHEAWWTRRSTCPDRSGAGFTVVVRALPADQTPVAPGPNTTL